MPVALSRELKLVLISMQRLIPPILHTCKRRFLHVSIDPRLFHQIPNHWAILLSPSGIYGALRILCNIRQATNTSPCSPNPITKVVKPPFTDHETTLEQYRKEEQKLLNTTAISEQLAKTTETPEPEERALGFVDQNKPQDVPGSIDLPWKCSPPDNISATGEDNFLGGWGDDF